MKVLASWNDMSTADLKVAELMLKYNIPTIFYWPSIGKNTANPRLAEQDCKNIASKFEIGSRSVSNRPMNKMTISQIGMEISDSRKHLQDSTGQEIKSFAYPKNSFNNLTKALVKGAGYQSARTSIPCWLHPGDDPFAIQCTVQVGIDRIEYGNKCWEHFAEEMLSRATFDSVFHIFGNSWDVELNNDWAALELFIKKMQLA